MLRIEKGHAAGNELNGQTTARDLGLGTHDVDQKGLYRPGAGGPPGAQRSGAAGADRLHAAWMRSKRLRGGAHFFVPGAAIAPGRVSKAI